MLYAALGPFLAYDSCGDVIAGLVPKHRQLLALLLLNANIAVHRDRLIDQLWNGRPPDSARRNLTTYIARLRRLLPPHDLELSPVRTSGNAYLLATPPHSTDAQLFDALAAAGRSARRNGELNSAAVHFDKALRLWRGDALFDLRGTDGLSAWAEQLDENRRSLTEDLFDVQLALDQHHQIVENLGQWTMRYPLRERPHRQLMLALHRSGRSDDASITYQRLRRTLIDEMGVDPTPGTQALYVRMLGHGRSTAFPPPTLSRQWT